MKAILAITCIALIAICCIEKNLNGQLISLSIAAIAGISGYEIREHSKNAT